MSGANGWQPIVSAPRDGREIPCCWIGGRSWTSLAWKYNTRIAAAHQQGDSLELKTRYFGDPNEMDDYDLAIAENQPTHWFDLPATPGTDLAVTENAP